MNDILTKLKKPLDISDVDFRVQSINTGGYATILAYKDARVDMNRLDEVCGINWQDKYETIDGRLFCSVGIKIDNEWQWRMDVGTESNTEKEKGQASDAFKRACFKWGIGRELYNYPVIQVKLFPNEFTIQEIQGKKVAKPTFELKLKEWKWNVEVHEGEVTFLQAIDNNSKMRFTFTKTYNPTPQAIITIEESQNKLTTASTLNELAEIWNSLPDNHKKALEILKNELKEKLSNGK